MRIQQQIFPSVHEKSLSGKIYHDKRASLSLKDGILKTTPLPVEVRLEGTMSALARDQLTLARVPDPVRCKTGREKQRVQLPKNLWAIVFIAGLAGYCTWFMNFIASLTPP